MNTEVELKYPVAEFSGIREILVRTGAKQLHPPVREINDVFDTLEGVLFRSGRLLRLRQVSGKVILTVKEPVGHATMKVRKEYETELSAGIQAAEGMLKALGYLSVYHYEKDREEWQLNGAHICFDQLYFGRFIEIECRTPEEVSSTAVVLGLDAGSALKESYRDLELRYLQEEKS